MKLVHIPVANILFVSESRGWSGETEKAHRSARSLTPVLTLRPKEEKSQLFWMWDFFLAPAASLLTAVSPHVSLSWEQLPVGRAVQSVYLCLFKVPRCIPQLGMLRGGGTWGGGEKWQVLGSSLEVWVFLPCNPLVVPEGGPLSKEPVWLHLFLLSAPDLRCGLLPWHGLPPLLPTTHHHEILTSTEPIGYCTLEPPKLWTKWTSLVL